MAPVELRIRIDPRVRSARETDLMLEAAEFTIRIGRGERDRHRNERALGGDPEERDVADVARQRGVLVRERKHEKLDRELDVHHAAGVVLQVERGGTVRMTRRHLAPHLDDVAGKRCRLAPQLQHLVA